MRDSIKTKCSNKDFIDISNLIIKSKEKEFKITKKHQIKKFELSTKVSSLQKHTCTGYHKEKVGDQLIQQAFNRWGAIPTTAWTQVYSKLSQGASYWVHCSY